MSLELELANVEPDRIEVLDVSKSFETKRTKVWRPWTVSA